MLGLLLAATDEAGAPIPTGVVRDQAVTLLFAGHDTTTTTFTFLVHELGQNPAVRNAVEDELDRALGTVRAARRSLTVKRYRGSTGLEGDAPLLSGGVGGAAAHHAGGAPGGRPGAG